MELFIRIKDNMPFEHPILKENLLQAFPGIDVDNLPPEFSRFERITKPNGLGPYEIYVGSRYDWVDGIVKDIHDIRAMTNEEKIEKQNQVKEQWQQNNGFASWLFDEITCSFKAPVEKPNDGNFYKWNEETKSWDLVAGSN